MDFLSKGEPCVMGERKIFKKRKPGAQCALGRDSSGTVLSEPCVCADWDFEWWVPWYLVVNFSQTSTCWGLGMKMQVREDVMPHGWKVCSLACGPDGSSTWARWEVCTPGRRTGGDIFTRKLTVLSEQCVQGNFFSFSVSSSGKVPERLGGTLTELRELPPSWRATSRHVSSNHDFQWELSLFSSFFPSSNNKHEEQL